MESPTPPLQKWQRNDIFEAIQAVGLDPRDFYASFYVPAPGRSAYDLNKSSGDPIFKMCSVKWFT
jgi:hypothetical protein